MMNGERKEVISFNKNTSFLEWGMCVLPLVFGDVRKVGLFIVDCMVKHSFIYFVVTKKKTKIFCDDDGVSIAETEEACQMDRRVTKLHYYCIRRRQDGTVLTTQQFDGT